MKTSQCSFCMGDEALLWIDGENSAFIDSQGEISVIANGSHLSFNVEYCPKCGRRFGVNYLNLKHGDDIFYVDSEMGCIEHGKIYLVTFKENEVNEFRVNFDDKTFEVFDGSGLGICFFTDEQEAKNALARSSIEEEGE